MLLEVLELIHELISIFPFLCIQNIGQILEQIIEAFLNFFYNFEHGVFHDLDPFVFLLLDLINPN
jgi:hypothetical protein